MMRVVLCLFGGLIILVVGWIFIVQPLIDKTPTAEEQKAKDIQAVKASKARARVNQQQTARQAPKVNPSDGPFGIGANPDAYYERGEVIVTNPPKNFNAAAAVLGFTVLESQTLPGLGIGVVRLKVPAGNSVPRARRLLAAQFPSISVDANHLYEAQQGSSLKVHARAAIGWGTATPSCGRGIRLGQIDAAVQLSHEALKGQRIQYRSYHRKGRSGRSRRSRYRRGRYFGRQAQLGRTFAWGGFVCGQYVRKAKRRTGCGECARAGERYRLADRE